jgi:RNA polymerase sigma-54 factor
LAFNENVSSSLEELEKILIKIQNFDPPGIGARDLRESLLLQLHKKDHGENKAIHLAQKILKNHMESFTKKHYQKIIRSLKITEEQLKEAIAEIVRLNPKPGGLGQVQAKTQYIIPDFTVVNTEGELKVLLNGRNTPDLRVNRAYSETLKNYDVASKKDKERLKDSVQYIKQKLDGAKWFIDSIRQRQHTLITTMQEIVKQQTEFFTDGDETSLKPMILKDIAEKVNLDISTISRVANSKYVETEFGMFALKFFFSEGVSNAEGEEVSNREIKKILSTAIVDENKRKPHTDEALMVLLKEKGYGIARRTVAKYREQLNIPVARLRKEI